MLRRVDSAGELWHSNVFFKVIERVFVSLSAFKC